MKKVMFMFATLLIGGLMLTGCKKTEPTPTPTPDPEPTATTVSVVYQVENQYQSLAMSDCFKLNVTYTDANGQEVTESGVTLPWSKTIEVTSPFKAKMQGEFAYNVEELPDQVVYGKRYGIGVYENNAFNVSLTGGFSSISKEKFLELIEAHPDRIQFTTEKDF